MVFRFGGFSLDTGRFELRRGEEPVALEPRVLELLVHLLRRRGRLVTKEELLAEVWEGRFVTESVLTRAVSEVRKALGEASWIRSVYGRGYRFEGEVEVEDAGEDGAGGGAEEAEAAADPAPADGEGRTVSAAPPPLPLTPLIGRERELAMLIDLVGERRLVTLTGPGGGGKTRLAVEAAHRLAAGAATPRVADEDVDESAGAGASAGAEGAARWDEVAFVPLAAIDHPDALPAAVARALGVRDLPGRTPLEGIAERLADGRRLLVLDNFEQVVAAAPFVAELLRARPRLAVLVTSRFVLGVEGEQELPVPPLAVPAEAAPFEATSHGAVALFLDRARAVRPGFDPDAAELAELAAICRALDGLPLAIELAAPLLRLFPPAELRRRLSERLDLLVSRDHGRDHGRDRQRPDRHRTLERALDWSVELLTGEERRFLYRLTVFAGGFTAEAAGELAAEGDGDALGLLAGLVEKSLVVRRDGTPGGGSAAAPRFGLLETTRELARRRLRDSGDEAPALAALTAWARRLAEEAEPALAGGDQGAWLARLDAEHDNLAAAMDAAASAGRLADALAIATAVWRWWSVRGLYREGYERMEPLLEHPDAAAVEPVLRARALTALGGLAHLLCELDAARRRIEEALELLRASRDRRGEAHALNHLGWIDAQLGDLDDAERHSRRALELHGRLGERRGRAVALNNLAWIAQYRGDWAAAARGFREALAARRASVDERGAAFALACLGQAEARLGRLAEARAAQREAAAETARLGDRPVAAYAGQVEGLILLAEGRAAEAAERFERTVAEWRAVGQLAGVAWCLACLGESHLAAGDLDAARAALDESIEIGRRVGIAWDLAQALRQRAVVAEREGDAELARTAGAEAAAIFERLGREPAASS